MRGGCGHGVHRKLGLKQGCPLSGSLFALAVDLLLRRLAQGPGPLDQGVFAYADDLALVLRLFKEGLARLLPIFRRWAEVSGHRVRLDKSVVVPLGAQTREHVQGDLDGAGEAAVEMKTSDAARYPGVVVGLGAEASQWDVVVARVLPRAKGVFRTGRWLDARFTLSKNHVLSLLSFKLQFAPASQAATTVVRQGLQCLTGALWMALPPAELEEGAELGSGGLRRTLPEMSGRFLSGSPSRKTPRRTTLWAFCRGSWTARTCYCSRPSFMFCAS